MPERIQSVAISVLIDTNKRTIKASFTAERDPSDALWDLVNWWNDQYDDLDLGEFALIDNTD